ncbi:MAG: dynamin family protein [Pseudonocardiaceae bacterium]
MTQQQEPSAQVRQAVEVLDLAIKGSRVYGRDDLVGRLTGARQLLTEPAVTVYVVGEFKQGKSSLINSLLTAPICPVDDDIATAVPTEVRYSRDTGATAHYEPDGDSPGADRVEPIPVADLASYVSEAGNPENRQRLRSVTVGIDRPLLAGGLVMVDTPGVGGLGSVHSNALAMNTLPRAHAVLFVSDASQELTDPELKFLWAAEELCPTILFVLTKTDLYPQWRRILEIDMTHLHRSGFTAVEAIPASSVLHNRAHREKDADLAAESGLPVLASALHGIVQDAEHVALNSVAHHVLDAVGQLETTLKSRKTALDHPERAEHLLAELTQARTRADRLRSKSARWQSVLLDGMSDVSSDVDFDLRSRVRLVQADADQAIDEGDPAENWAEFESWLRQRLAAETLENYALLVRRTKEVAHLVAEYFEHEEAAVVPAEVKVPEPVTMTETGKTITAPKVSVKTGLTVLQKGLMGFGMMLMLGNAIPFLTIPAGIALVAGSLMGISSFKEDRTRQLEKRRSDAKKAVRDFIGEFTMQVGKDSRDDRSLLQRELRNDYTQLAEELQRSMSEALSAAQQSVNAHETDNKEVQRMNADLKSLESLRSRAMNLAVRETARPGSAVAAAATVSTGSTGVTG